MATVQERNAVIGKYFIEQMDILDRKGKDYTGGQASIDGCHNFKEIAKRFDGAPLDALTVIAIEFMKHVMALETYVKTRHVESEGMSNRFNDIANYSNMMRFIFEESNNLLEPDFIDAG